MKTFLIVLIFSTIFGYSTQIPQNVVTVSIFYESLCPDSIRFITRQLYPNYEIVKDHIKVDFVPYGKAVQSYTDGQWKFECQHGPQECHGNLVQACALDVIEDQDTKVKFVNCVMASEFPAGDNYMEECAKLNDVDWGSILECLDDGSGDILLSENGDRTHAVTPTITFIPTITYDGVYDAELQNNSLVDFLSTVCKVIGNDVC